MIVNLTVEQEKLVTRYAAMAVFPTAAEALVDAALRYIQDWFAKQPPSGSARPTPPTRP